MVRSNGSVAVFPQRETRKRNAGYRDVIQGFFCLGYKKLNYSYFTITSWLCCKELNEAPSGGTLVH